MIIKASIGQKQASTQIPIYKISFPIVITPFRFVLDGGGVVSPPCPSVWLFVVVCTPLWLCFNHWSVTVKASNVYFFCGSDTAPATRANILSVVTVGRWYGFQSVTVTRMCTDCNGYK